MCTLAAYYNFMLGALGFNFDDYLIGLFEDNFRDEVEDALTSTFNLAGLGQSFLDLDPYIQAMPSALFQQIGLTKGDVLNVLRNPFSGISVKVRFDEDDLGFNGANDRILIWTDVHWEHVPVASFNYTHIGATEIRLNASSSYDPDGGPLT